MLLKTESIGHCAPLHSLPSRLPSQDEIARSSEFFSKRAGCAVVGVGRHYVVKYGSQVDLNEGETMLHVARSTAVRVPQVFALFRDEENKKNYIIMERIHGETLEQLWPSLSQVEKEEVSSRLKASMDELRRLPSPGVFCALKCRPLPDRLLQTQGASFADDGTYDSEQELNSALLDRYAASETRPVGKVKFYSRMWPAVFARHPPTFTHGDLQRKNIILVSSEAGIMSIALLDWETAGWYPDYWEYVRAFFACARFEDDWNLWLDTILKPFPREYAWMYILIKEMWV
jgi:hypothetical protein